jgi:radical SAM-linked protein
MKIRVKFSKQGMLRFVGHLDLMRYFQKAILRAGIPIRFSEGFSPHQIMTFAAPLGMGITGLGEYMDIETVDALQETLPSALCIEKLNREMAEGVHIERYLRIPDETENAMATVASADYRVQFTPAFAPAETELLKSRTAAFLHRESIPAQRTGKNGTKEIDIRPMIGSLTADGDGLVMNIAQGSAANLKPQTLLEAFFADDADRLCGSRTHRIIRTEIYDKSGRRLDEYGNDIV